MEIGDINQIAQGVIDGTTAVSRYLPEPLAEGVSFVSNLAGAALSGNELASQSSDQLIAQQIELQREMLQVTLFSNLERTRHETQMAPVRNLRVA